MHYLWRGCTCYLYLTGVIPQELWELGNLEILDLATNGFEGMYSVGSVWPGAFQDGFGLLLILYLT